MRSPNKAKKDEYFVITWARWAWAKPTFMAIIAAVILIIIAAVIIGSTADVAHTAGVSSWG